MPRNIDPFKIELLIPTKNDLMGVKPVKVMDIMEGFSKNFHPDGLFSAEIFGKVGEQRRSRTMAYIDLNVKIFHPLIYKVICDLKSLYQEIMEGRSYAIFDEASSDFIKSNVAEGETGYDFFVRHFPKLKFEKRKSISRDVYIKFVEMYRNNAFISQLVVLPAGMRDYMVDEDGKPSEDEINALYRSIMAVAANMENLNIDRNPAFVNSARANLQTKVLELYKYIIGLLIGKNKLIQGSFLARKASNTTRNVISSYIPAVTKYGDSKSVDPNMTVIGMYQHMRNLIPLLVYNLRNKIMPMVFSSANMDMHVTDPKTWKKKRVGILPKEFNRWMTYEGIEKIADGFGQEATRHYPVMIGDNYAGLIYKGPDGTFKLFQDIDDLPPGRNKKDVTPITMAELLYVALYEAAETSVGFVTRYPVTLFGSTYPCRFYLRSTIRDEARRALGYDWEIDPNVPIAKSFPIKDIPFFNSMSPSTSHLPRLGGDFDGDTMSAYCVMTDEAVKEINDMLNSRDFYLTLDNKMAFSLNTDMIGLSLKYLTTPR